MHPVTKSAAVVIATPMNTTPTAKRQAPAALTSTPMPARLKTREEAREEFAQRGISIYAWSKARGLSPQLVYEILGGKEKRKCLRGQCHRAAVLLGLKHGDIDSGEDAPPATTTPETAGACRFDTPSGDPAMPKNAPAFTVTAQGGSLTARGAELLTDAFHLDITAMRAHMSRPASIRVIHTSDAATAGFALSPEVARALAAELIAAADALQGKEGA